VFPAATTQFSADLGVDLAATRALVSVPAFEGNTEAVQVVPPSCE